MKRACASIVSVGQIIWARWCHNVFTSFKFRRQIHRQPCGKYFTQTQNSAISAKLIYRANNAQVATSLLTSCNNLFQQADIRMRSHGLRQLVDDKSVASCQETCCKLIVKTCYPQPSCKFFQQVVRSLQMTICSNPGILTALFQLYIKTNEFVATCWQFAIIR